MQDKKLVLGPNKVDIIVIKICMYIMIGITLILWILFNIFFDNNLLIKYAINIIFLFINGIHFYLLYICSTQIIIDKNIIIKKIIFNRNKILCNIKDITAFSENYSYIIALKDNNKLLSFPYNGINNSEFQEYLEKNCDVKAYFEGQKYLEIVYLYLAVIIFIICAISGIVYIGFLLMTILLYCSVKENRKFVIFNEDGLIYRKIFSIKKENISNLKKIIYIHNTGIPRYRPLKENYKLMIYIKNKKIVINNVLSENLNIIKEIATEKNIKLIEKK